MGLKTPRVSILTCSYNHAPYIGRTIESVLSQSFSDWEYLIVDDGSLDNSAEVIRSYQDPRIRSFLNSENKNVAIYNELRAQCRGEYFVSLDSDDAMTSGRLARQIEFLDQHPDVQVLGTWIQEIDRADVPVAAEHSTGEAWFNQERDFNDARNWIWQNRLNHSSVMMRSSFHDAVGPFNPLLPRSCDYEFWLRCLSREGKIEVLREKLTYYRNHGENVTHRDPTQSCYELAHCNRQYVLPLLERAADVGALSQVWGAWLGHPSFRTLPLAERGVVLGDFARSTFSLPFSREELKNRASHVVSNGDGVFRALGKHFEERAEVSDWQSKQVASLEKGFQELSTSLKVLKTDHAALRSEYEKCQSEQAWLQYFVSYAGPWERLRFLLASLPILGHWFRR